MHQESIGYQMAQNKRVLNNLMVQAHLLFSIFAPLMEKKKKKKKMGGWSINKRKLEFIIIINKL